MFGLKRDSARTSEKMDKSGRTRVKIEESCPMSDIEDLERRITAAMERIGRGLDGLGQTAVPDVDPEEMEALRSALDAESAKTTELEERVEQITQEKAELEQKLSAQDEAIERQKETLQRLDETLQQLQEVNAQLRSNNTALRKANAAGVGDAGLINRAMEAELDGLRAAQMADREELTAVLEELKPLIAGEAS